MSDSQAGTTELIDGHPSEEIVLTVTAELTCSPRYARNTLHMKYEPCDVSDGAGNRLGSISPCVGGGIELHDEATGETWTVDTRALWFAFQAALHRA